MHPLLWGAFVLLNYQITRYMRKLIWVITSVALLAAIALQAKTDPVLMKVGDSDIKLSEFLYLFNKNKSQQQEPLSTRQYLNLFTDYKLKVLAAHDAGLDTAAKFLTDIRNYTYELTQPYMVDTVAADSMRRLTYQRMQVNPDISLITINSRANARENMRVLDSIRALVQNGEDFNQLAERFSDDPYAKKNNGHLGYITEGVLPFLMDNAAFTTPAGQVSEPFTTQYGSHIIMVHGTRPDIGQVKVRHILKSFRNSDSSDSLRIRFLIDSIYTALQNGADFLQTAARFTDDPSGKKNGGDLPWFGAGRMVPEFEKTAFATPVGELSEPFRTPYGYHIILKEGERHVGSFEDEKKEIDNINKNPERAEIARNSFINKMREKIGVTINPKAQELAETAVARHGKTPPVLAELEKINTPAATVGNVQIPVRSVAATIPSFSLAANIPMLFSTNLNNLINKELQSQITTLLRKEHSDLDNLVNEYHDGILLYEISNDEVWNKPQTDPEGLRHYFQENRAKYTWDQPRFKGFLIMAQNDSTARLAADYINSNPQFSSDSLSVTLRKKFGNKVRLERVLAPQGSNKIVDYVAFGGERPAPLGSWSSFLPVRHKIIAQPEEANDVKGAVSVDWQKALEEQWIQKLRRTYKVKVNEKVLESIK